MENLSPAEWEDLLRLVFEPRSEDRVLGIWVDVPDERVADREAWADRRRLALEWSSTLPGPARNLGLESVELVAYPNVGSNNGDLPSSVFLLRGEVDESVLASADALRAAGEEVPLDSMMAAHDLILLPTEFSATAPMKLAAKKHGYRAATMPGFARDMVPALRIDFGEVARRLGIVKERLDAADEARVRFEVRDPEGGTSEESIVFDLRHRAATVSAGLLREPGIAGNLPSGETYIVPFEGLDPSEGSEGDPSRTEGTLPVEFDGEIVRYRIRGNDAFQIDGDGTIAERERDFLSREPAYGNIAELGFGVLRDLGVQPVGSILLDEKLGFHVAFGRSDHFGGAVGTSDFKDPANVVHIDRIYIPETQPRVRVKEIRLVTDHGSDEVFFENGRYSDF